MVSRVVPAISVTMFLSSPISVFKREDLPTFGRPIMANLGISSSSSSGVSSRLFTTSSNNSPVPLPLIDEILKISLTIPNP